MSSKDNIEMCSQNGFSPYLNYLASKISKYVERSQSLSSIDTINMCLQNCTHDPNFIAVASKIRKCVNRLQSGHQRTIFMFVCTLYKSVHMV